MPKMIAVRMVPLLAQMVLSSRARPHFTWHECRAAFLVQIGHGTGSFCSHRRKRMLEGEIRAGPQLATCDLPCGAMGSAAFLPLAFLCRRPPQRTLLYSLASASFGLTSGVDWRPQARATTSGSFRKRWPNASRSFTTSASYSGRMLRSEESKPIPLLSSGQALKNGGRFPAFVQPAEQEAPNLPENLGITDK